MEGGGGGLGVMMGVGLSVMGWGGAECYGMGVGLSVV